MCSHNKCVLRNKPHSGSGFVEIHNASKRLHFGDASGIACQSLQTTKRPSSRDASINKPNLPAVIAHVPVSNRFDDNILHFGAIDILNGVLGGNAHINACVEPDISPPVVDIEPAKRFAHTTDIGQVNSQINITYALMKLERVEAR